MAWTSNRRVVAARQRWAPANALVGAYENYGTHRTSQNATLVGHYGFLSVFPLLAVFTTILGLVLDHRPDLRDKIVNSTFRRIPIIGDTLARDPTRLTGSWVVLVLGLLTSLWAGMQAFGALQTALDDIAEVPADARPRFVDTRLRSLLGIAVVGAGQLATAGAAGLVGVSGVRLVHKVLAVVGTVVLNTTVLAATYRWLCSQPLSWRRTLPGAMVAGVLFAALQVAGATIVSRAISNASPIYGTFATVIALLSWLSLHAMVALLGAELNRVLPARRLDGATAAAPPTASR